MQIKNLKGIKVQTYKMLIKRRLKLSTMFYRSFKTLNYSMNIMQFQNQLNFVPNANRNSHLDFRLLPE